MIRSKHKKVFVSAPLSLAFRPGVPSALVSGVTDSLPAVILADSPIAYWKLDEASGATATDSSGNGNNATYNGTASITYQATIGSRKGVTVPGNNTGVSIAPPSTVLAIATSGSAKSYEMLFSTTDTDGALFYVRTNTNSTPVVVICLGFNAVANSGTGKPSLLVRDTGGNLSSGSSATAVNDGAVHHIIVTRTTGKVWSVYIDGNTTPVITFTDAFSGGVTPDESSLLTGATVNTYGTTAQMFLAGTVAQAAVYNTALSTTRVAAHFAAV